jgi:hypothetical protein
MVLAAEQTRRVEARERARVELLEAAALGPEVDPVVGLPGRGVPESFVLGIRLGIRARRQQGFRFQHSGFASVDAAHEDLRRIVGRRGIKLRKFDGAPALDSGKKTRSPKNLDRASRWPGLKGYVHSPLESPCHRAQ